MQKKIILFKYPLCIMFSYFVTYEILPGIDFLLPLLLLLALLLPYVIIPYFFALQAKLAIRIRSNFWISLGLCFLSLCILIINPFNAGVRDLKQLLDFSSLVVYILNATVYTFVYLRLKKKNS